MVPLLAAPLACGPPDVPTAAVFVRRGVLLPDRTLLDRDWSPGERVEGAVAPVLAACVPLFSLPLDPPLVPLGDGPDTAVAFSPDGERLAVGSAGGEVVVADARTGAEVARRTLSEALVRQVAWSADGTVLYAAEQSPDAAIWALDPASLAPLASARLSDHVGTSPLPDGDDPYAAYEMPAAYALRPLDDGTLLVAAVHGWTTTDGRRNAARVLRLRRVGDALVQEAAWPAGAAADAVLGALDVDGGRVAVAVRRSADGPAPPELPVDGVQLLALRDLAPAGEERFAPLAPWFGSVFVWDALALLPDGLVAGTGDGRVIVRRSSGELVEPVGTPITAGETPIAASVGFLRADGAEVYAVTSRTYVPAGPAAADAPPRPHPQEGAVLAWNLGEGLAPRFAWRGPHDVAGIALSSREVAVGSGARGDRRTDLFGALVFDRDGDGRPTAHCATEGPAHFRLALAEDGRVAVAEVPWVEDGQLRGAYRVTVLR